ncbi:MAG: ABC transporter permease, partial [Actinomyces sp.]
MKAMIVKEFLQMRRDRRTLALMVGLPLLLLIVFGHAARFDVTEIRTAVFGVDETTATGILGADFDLVEVRPDGDRAAAVDTLRRAEAQVALVVDPGAGRVDVLVDGTELFVAQSALRRAGARLAAAPVDAEVEVLFNPDLETAPVMVPSLIGLILLFIGAVITSLGVVREREQGTLELLAVTPLRPADVVLGKIAPYFAVAVVDMALVTAAGLILFDVPFRGSWLLFAVFALVYLFVVLGLGVLISTVSRSQGEAIQLAIMALLPQVMLSGMIFPLASMSAGVRWIGWLLPLTWFVAAMRGIFLRGAPVDALVFPLVYLTAMAAVVFG